MNISELSIRRPVFAWMLMAALIIFGWISFERMGIGQMPDVDFPVIDISVSLQGAAPEVMEINVVEPIEEAIMSVQGIKKVTSTSAAGNAHISVEFNLNHNLDVGVQDVQAVISKTTRLLPKDIDPPVISKVNPEDQPILWFAVTSDRMTPEQLMSYVREHVKDRFTTAEGVGEIFLGGFVEPNMRVTVSIEKLRKYQLTASDIIQAIRNEHSELPSGRIESKTKELNVRTMGEASTAKEFAKLPIIQRGGKPNFAPLTLDQVADVKEGLADIRRISRSNGRTAVGLGLRKQRGANAIVMATAAKERLAALQKQLPEGIEIAIDYDATEFIAEAVHELTFTLILSALLTAVVCWGFLGSLSATVNVILAIPTSIIGSFIVLNALGFTLNTFTLLGLSLAIGIVVDDAIMVLENIVRHLEMGKNRMEASLVGSREITFAAIAATAAVIAIFLPVAFMQGLIGKYFFQFGVTLSVAVAISLLEALTLAPMRCSQFLEMGERKTRLERTIERAFRFCEQTYSSALAKSLNHRWTTIGVAGVIFVASCALVWVIKKEFVPPQDQSMLLVQAKTETGSSLEFTDEKFRQVEKIISESPEVRRYYASVGGWDGGEVDTGNAFVTMKPKSERRIRPGHRSALSQQEFADELRKQFAQIKDAKVFIQDLSLGGFSSGRGFPVEFTVRGPDWDTLKLTAQQLMKSMEETKLMTDIDSNYRSGSKEVRIRPDREKALMRGVSILEINQTVNALIGGIVVGKFSRGNYRYDVRVRLNPEERNEISDLDLLEIRNNRGQLIPLSQLVTVTSQDSVQSIGHDDRERAISIFANVSTGVSQEKAIEKVQTLAKKILPSGYRTVMSGDSETFEQSFKQLTFALILGVVVAYMVLASQFNSFIHPVIVLLALPFSLSGAFVALLAAHQSLNIYSMIGIILLMGIVKKNSILLVDFTNQLRSQGHSVLDALQNACPIRLRPILMTSLATIAGAIPPALSLGPGAESRIPMAISVIGGILISTLLTLFVVPCAYSLMSRRLPASPTP